MHREVRKPLVIFTPKSLLRAKQARSPIGALAEGTSFQEVLDDPRYLDGGEGDPATVQRVVLCSGKVAHEALASRDERGAAAAVVRVEQLYPWPEEEILSTLARYERAEEVVWLQEEPENMGPWNFVHGRLHRVLRDDYRLRHVSRAESGSPATGSHAIHVQEQQQILDEALG
jgi:2-oxoglutarate dehydrogenase E1 component